MSVARKALNFTPRPTIWKEYLFFVSTVARPFMSIFSIMKSFGIAKCDNFVNNDFMGTDVVGQGGVVY